MNKNEKILISKPSYLQGQEVWDKMSTAKRVAELDPVKECKTNMKGFFSQIDNKRKKK